MKLCRLFAVVCLIESFYVGCFSHPENKNDIRISNGTCLNEKCIKEDPCESFFDYTCDGFVETDKMNHTGLDFIQHRITRIIQDEFFLNSTLRQTHNMPVLNAFNLFDSCLNRGETFFSDILEFIFQNLNGWPLLNEKYFNNDLNITYKSLLNLNKIGIDPFFKIEVDVDPFNTTRNAIWIRKSNSFHFKKDRVIELSLKDFLNKFIKLLGTENSDEYNSKYIDSLFYLNQKLTLVNVDLTLYIQHTFDANVRKITIRELAKQLPQFEWNYFLAGLFKDMADIDIGLDQTVVVADFESLKANVNVFSKSTQQNLRDLDNLVVWEYIKTQMQFLSSINFSANKTDEMRHEIIKYNISNYFFCTKYGISTMNLLFTKYYVQNHYNNSSTKQLNEMVEYIRHEFKLMINKSANMDTFSKQNSIEKFDKMEFLIGYPEYIANDTILNDIYKNFDFNKTHFIRNEILTRKLCVRRNYMKLDTSVNRLVWTIGPLIPHVHHFKLTNQIWIPASVIQAPFFDTDHPNYLNFARLGFLIAHDMAHSITNEGRKYDKDGIYHSDDSQELWKNTTIEHVKSKKKCFIKQYNDYTIRELSIKLDGNQTLEENLGDNIGFEMAYKAYKKWEMVNGAEKLMPGLEFDQDQLFFIAFSQSLCEKNSFRFIFENFHAPYYIRANGVMQNSIEFNNSFKCKSILLNNTCSIW